MRTILNIFRKKWKWLFKTKIINENDNRLNFSVLYFTWSFLGLFGFQSCKYSILIQRLHVDLSVKIAFIQQTVKCVYMCFTVLMTFMLSWQIHQAACFKNVSVITIWNVYYIANLLWVFFFYTILYYTFKVFPKQFYKYPFCLQGNPIIRRHLPNSFLMRHSMAPGKFFCIA